MNKIVTIPGRVYDAMMQEVMRLPARKRKNYKTFVLSKRGCRTKVVYRDGRLWNRDDDPASPWHGQYVRMARTPDNLAGLADVSPFARAMLTAEDPVAAFKAEVEKNHTGNHKHRIKTVRVPTAPGNGVRG